MKKTILTSLAAALILSCTHNPKDKVSAHPIFKQSPLDSAFAVIRPAVQLFTIDNGKVNKIKAAGGTEVMIPAGSLETADGEKVENAQLEIVEASSLAHFVSSGLVTMSGDSLLMSNGMVYINARRGDERLQLAKGAKLTVSMPTMGARGGYSLFTGNGSNWKIDSSMTDLDYSIPMPLDLLYPLGNELFELCITHAGDKDEKKWGYDTTVLNVNNRKYENTVIATDEFRQRYYALMGMTWWTSFFVDSDYHFHRVECEGEKFNLDLWRVYFDHPNRRFKESDSIVKKLYLDYFEANKEKLAIFCDRVNAYDRTYYYNWTDTNHSFDFRKKSMKEQYMGVLDYFPSKNIKEIRLINDHGVDLSRPDAYEKLRAKGVDIAEINQIMEYQFRRQSMIKELRRQKDVLVNQASMEKMYESTVFSVTQMGWINCDRFFDDPTAGKAAIYVSNSSHNQLDYIDCSLVIPSINARLTAYPDKAGRWRFTKEDGRYTRLPIGRDAVVTGVSLQHDSLYFASKKIKITDSLLVDLPMAPISKGSLNDSLARALK